MQSFGGLYAHMLVASNGRTRMQLLTLSVTQRDCSTASQLTMLMARYRQEGSRESTVSCDESYRKVAAKINAVATLERASRCDKLPVTTNVLAFAAVTNHKSDMRQESDSNFDGGVTTHHLPACRTATGGCQSD